MRNETYLKAVAAYEAADRMQTGLISGDLPPLLIHSELCELTDQLGELVDLIAAAEEAFAADVAEAVCDLTTLD